jgi:RNA polymerase sigma factor (sigma-70 family)
MDSGLSIAARAFYAPPVQELHTTSTPTWRAGSQRATPKRKRRSGGASRRAFACSAETAAQEAAAADLVQDVLIAALQKLRAGAVREPERIASFMLGMARQMMLDSMRNSGRRERILNEFPIDLIPVEEPAAEEPNEGRLQHCLQALPERERTVLVMTFYDDCPADALGTQLGLSREWRDSPSRPATPAHDYRLRSAR